jgi:hypothetical protein
LASVSKPYQHEQIIMARNGAKIRQKFGNLCRPVVSFFKKPHPRLERMLTRTPVRLLAAFGCGFIGMPLWASIIVIGLVTGIASAAYPYTKKYFQEKKIKKKTSFWSSSRIKSAKKDFLIGTVYGAVIGGLETSGILDVAFRAVEGGVKHGVALLTKIFNGKSSPPSKTKNLLPRASPAMGLR